MSRKNVEDIYPLSPMQQGMLFHTLYAAEGGVYVVQRAFTLRGNVDVDAFVKAFQDVTDRHPILRTAFVWERREQPLQVVREKVRLPVESHDLRGISPADQQARLAQFLDADRRRGFDLGRAPLMRLALFRLSDREYRSIWSSHHILLDGWSTPPLLKEVFSLYQSHVAGAVSKDARLERVRPYGEYIGWLQKQDGKKVEAFWRERLRGFSAPTPFGVDHPASGPAQVVDLRASLSAEISAALQTTTRQHQLTLSTLMIGAFGLLLSRYSGEEDVLFGATVSGRSLPVPGIEKMVGLFINSLPARVLVEPSRPVVDWLRTLQSQQAELRDYEHSHLVVIQGQSEIPRGTPLFESLVVFENYPFEESMLQSLSGLEVVDAKTTEESNFPLTLVGSFRGNIFSLRLSYDRSRFDDAIAERMLGHLVTLIESLAGDPSRLVGDLPMIGAAEARSLLTASHGKTTAYPTDALIHQLFEAQADRAPDAVALVFEGQQLSYSELDRRANQLAHALRKRGVGPETIVGVCLDRSLELVIALYAVLKAGGAYLPLDPEYPRSRLAFMLEDAKAPVLLTQSHLEGLLPPHSAAVLRLDTGWDEIASEPDSRLPRGDLGLSSLAYVIYTSGSTGRPKGVMNEHGGILNRLSWMQDAHGLTGADRVLQKTPFSFDVSVWEFFWPLMFGATLVVAKPEGHKDPRYLAETIASSGITTMHFVPSMLTAFLDELASGPSRGASLKRVFASGEALLPSMVDAFHALLPTAELHNLYGPTEAAVDVTAWTAIPGSAIVPIGKPIDNVAIYLLDPRRALVPEGVRGELYIGGVQVARGYLNRAELTADRFVENAAGERLYRTGDVARWLPTGDIEYLGRVDHQVKVRGFRIELGEIEAVLDQHPGVREAVVLAREDSPGNKRLVAYICPRDAAPAEGDLKSFIKARLPDYMVPSAFLILDALPLTSSGKIDRKALPAPESAASAARLYVAPRGPIEEALAGLFADVLKLPVSAVGAHDSFFEVGGHSLLATQAISRIRGAFGVELPLRDLFEAATPAELAVRVERALGGGAVAAIAPLTTLSPDARAGDLALSFAQERLWFLAELEPNDPSYNIALVRRLAGALDRDALGKALSALVARHEILHTVFAAKDGRPVARVRPAEAVALPVVNLASLPEADREAAVTREIAAEAQRPFNLATGPLFRARLVEAGESDHVLLLTLHHIVTDAWSQGVLNRELGALYASFLVGGTPTLPELPIQYADYAAWQRHALEGAESERQLAYWKPRLAGAARSLDLPADRPRPPVPSHRGDRRAFTLSPEITRALKDLSRREGATLFMTLLAGFEALLHRLTGQTDLLLGTPIANRGRAETEGLIGFFLNTLVLRTDLSGDPPFRELVGRVREASLGAYAHQDMPFERLVQEVEPERDPSRSPLFQVMFTLQNAAEPLSLPGLVLQRAAAPNATAKFDLSLALGETTTSPGLSGSFEFSTDLFDGATIERMIEHFTVLLGAAAADPTKRLGELPILGAAERQTLLVTFNDTAGEHAEDTCIHEVFEAHAKRQPDAPALVFEGQTLSYRELDERANQLAHHLRARGVGPEILVGISMHRSLEMIVAVLGTLKAGGAYVPLDPTYPKDRLSFMLADANVKVLLTEAAVVAELPAHAAEVVCLDNEWPTIARESREAPAPLADENDLAYVIYTSGSTGKPKGVMVEHHGLVNVAEVHARAFKSGPDSRVLQLASLNFDASVWEIVMALLNGGCLVLASADALLPGPDLLKTLADNRITALTISPSVLAALPPASLPDLRTIVVAGEACSEDLVSRWAPGRQFIDAYGPTETSVCASLGECFAGGGKPSIGKPISNHRILILDPAGGLLPIGVPGELCVGGVGLARGYLHRPELTAEKFIADPHSAVPGQRLYRTGDLARFLPDGTLEYLGRIDHQVKIRGFRIELGEIEAVLSQHPAVGDAAVIVREDRGDKRLIAYLVARAGHEISSTELRAHLKDRLLEHMVPAAFVALEAMPLTPSGKVSRGALLALAAPDTAAAARDFIAPRGPVEEAIAGIWAEILRLPRVSAHDGFFELGGHSLLATQAVARLRAAFDVEIPLRALFEAPSPADLAVRVDAALRAGRGVQLPPLTRASREGAIALSFAQERLWFLDQLEPGDPSYVMASAIRLDGALDVSALERALAAIVARHEILRTTFTTASGKPAQIIHPSMDPGFSITDLSALAAAEADAAVASEIAIEARRPFDLAHGPILRARVLRLSADRHVLLHAVHHIASDGWSNGVFTRELGALYQAFVAGSTPALPELPIQYADHAAWQRRWFVGAALEQQLWYWRGHLAGAPAALDLPADRPRPPAPSHRGDRRSITLPPALAPALSDLSRREGTTLFMTLLAAFDVLLYRYTGQGDLVVGTPIAGRAQAETEGLIGFFINTLALRAEITGEMSFRALLQQVKETCLGAYAHQDMPFERLVQELVPERDLSRSPLFQVTFTLQNTPREALALGGLTATSLRAASDSAKFDLTLAMIEGPHGLTALFEYSTDLFDAATVERLASHLGVLLEGIVANPGATVASLPILPAAERQTLLVDFNRTRVAYARGATIHGTFEAHAARQPGAPALVFEGQTLSYRELDERANQLAHHLRARGVGPSVLVGISMHRSLEMIVAVLGTLKAGGAYVPLDPTYPKDRLSFMLEDARVEMLLTQASVAADLPAHEATVLCLDRDWPAIAAGSRALPAPLATDTDLAYVIYTSGSTGKPKGVMVEHHGLVNVAEVHARAFRSGPDSRVLQLASLSFDASVWEMVMALLNGGCLVLASADALLPGPDLLKTLTDNRITALTISPSVLAALPLTSLPDLRTIVVAGEACSEDLVSRWAPGRQFIDAYGPTETSVCASLGECFAGGGKPSIGKPISNHRILILDPARNLAPIGVPGELCVGGVGLARGYLNRPELTADRFIADPFVAGERLYRTGDLARFLPDGTLEYLGRIDHQVKIRGFRIELGEIEAVLAQHPAVSDAVVIARDDRGEKRLVAYVIVVGDLPVADLKAHLRDALPDYMVPAAIVRLAAMPLTPAGKIDHRALPAPDLSSEPRVYVEPRGPVEQGLAAIFAEVLQLPEVSAHDGFFDLGGHSLLATQVIARVRASFGVELPLRALFEATTPGALAVRVEAALRVGAGPVAPPLVRAPREGAMALSFAQERLWFLDQLEPNDPTYVVPLAMRLEGPLEIDALAAAIAALVARHEILRTTYTSQHGLPAAVIHDHVGTPLPVTSLVEIPATAREAALREATAEEARRPFDLAAGPVLRARLFALDVDSHLLLLTMHHIVSDGWTLGILNRELAAFHDAFASGAAPALPELPIQYADYAAWQRRWIGTEGDVLATQLAYWKGRLAGAPRALVLPADRPRPAVQSHGGNHRLFNLSVATSDALRGLARREGVTLFMLLLAAFDVLLARTTGQPDIVVGTPVAGRTRAETEGLIGFFINTLVLRTDVAPELSFQALLARVREACLGAYAHQDMPFERLVQELEPERDLSRSPLFQVLFTLQNAPREAMALSGLALRRQAVESRAAKFDLTLTMADTAGRIGGALEFATDLFDGATIDRMVAHFTTLLEGIAADPAALVGDLPFLPDSERQTLLGWSDTGASFPVGMTIHQLFEWQVERTPDAVAVTLAGETLTYRQLDERANRLGQHLLQMGVGKDVLVGLAVRRSLSMVVGILGILKAGGAYLPLDPEYPKDRLAFMIEDSKIGTLLTEADLVASLPPHQARVIRLDADWPQIEKERGDRPFNRTVPSGLAYVIYTSGSTGKPKGALVTHENVVRLFTATDDWYGFNATDVWTLFHSYAFDFSVWEIWGALLYGGRLVIVPYWVSRDPAAFYQLLGDEGVTVLNQTPSAFRQLTHVDASAAPKAAAALRLRYVIFGGEALDLGDLRGWWERHGDAQPQLVNMYGITETTVHVTYRPVGLADLRRAWSSVIGKSIPDLQVYVLDPQQRLLPIGIPGEMYVGGAGVSRGYLRRPELTAERFLPDPFHPGKRLYRTGDLARVLEGGDIEYLGRIDHQVKIRGFRIELGEIEAVLDQHPAVREAVVLAREDAPGEKRLVAYLVCSGEAPKAADLRAFLKEKLPDYMVPAAFVSLAALPITENGKVDRRALPAPDASVVEARAHVAPRGPVEEGIAAIFAEVLKLPLVSARDGFFELGGHSLLATQAIARIRAAFGVELPLRSLFEAPSPAELAGEVERALQGGLTVVVPPVTRVSRRAPLALSFAQERLWFLNQFEPEDTSYIIPLALRLTGDLDPVALQRALGALVARHEVLRTTFSTHEGRPIQVIHASLDLPLPLIVLGEGTRHDRDAALTAELTESARRPFDLATGPLLRARLFRLDPREHVLALTMHHIVSDAWSRGVMNRELGAFYAAFSEGVAPSLPELPLQYADYAAWQRLFLSGDSLERELAYWKQALGGAPGVLDLPTDRPRPAIPAHRGERRFFTLAKSLGDGLNALARREGVTLFMLLLAAFDVLLHRTTGQGDLVVGTPIANRTRAETESLIGFFVNTLVLRARLDGDLSFQALVRQVRETCLGAYAHQDMPFERLVTELAPERDLSRTPLFQVIFALQNAPAEGIALPGLQISGVMAESATSKFDLTLVMGESKDGLVCSFEYDVDLFDGATIERMLGHFRSILEGVVADPTAKIGDLPMLSPAERHRLLTELNDVNVVYPADTSIHALFEQQVDRSPDAPALTVDGVTLTYRELDDRANQLARHLVGKGVKPGALVGLCVQRSVEMMVGILGILKAGGAYVPLDPEYPKPRLAFMVEDSKVAVLLTQSELVDTIPAHQAEVIRLDADWPTIAAQSTDRLAYPPDPYRTAYVIYTSGSTGKPKGAMVTHANVARLFTATDAWYGFNASDVWTMFHSYAFDFSVWEIWGALLYGGRLVIVPYWISREPAAFYKLLGDEGVTVLNQTPSAFRQLTHIDESAAPQDAAALRLRYVIFGGEALDIGDLRGWWDRHGDTKPQLVNMYGITETTVHVTYRPVNKGDLDRAWSSVIGKTIPDLQVYVLDPRQQLLPIGVPGEMYVGGAGVSRGYLERPELTAERFLPDPFNSRPGARVYRTGDLARVLLNGDIEYLGRIDHQVKIRGFRIELGEIEAVLDTHPAVREAVVLAREDGPGEKRLVAYLVCRDGQAPTVGELRAFVKDKLPDSMVPSAFVLLAALPLTENGKVDRRALPAPEEGERPALGAEFLAPSIGAEEELAKIWASVLRLDTVGVRDNFFEIGGDSILSIQIVARAQQAGFRITPRQLFQHPTIAELAEVVGFTAEVTAEQGAVTGQAPLTPIQRWWQEQRLVEPHHHNQSSFLEVPGGIDADALEQALAGLLAHHDALRVRLAEGAQTFAAPGGPVPLLRVDLASVAEDERKAVIEKAAAEAQASLDLTDGPVLRAVLFESGAGGPGRVLLVIHHLAVDGVSWRILLDDLWTAYEQRRRGEAIALPPKTTSFKRWAEKLDAYARSEIVAEEREFWLDPVRERPGRLPVDHQDGENLESMMRVVTVSLSPEETTQLLREVPEAYQTQINDILLAAFAQAFGDFTSSDVVLVDLEGHGREELFDDVDLTRTVGWFTTVYPVVLDLDAQASAGATIKSVKEQLRAIPTRGIGHGALRYLREGDALSTALAALPQAEVSFNYLGQLDQALPESSPFRWARESSGPTHSPRARRRYLLDFNGSVAKGVLTVRFLYSEATHDRETVERLAARYLDDLRGLIAHCLSPDAGGYTPSDFQQEELTQDVIDMLAGLDDD
jgi:amino acid adenylation domain-containing protein/non-ribosomal peptide synthase protein (TIGR01720 family)